jgi:hypothetical protein
MVLTIVSIYVTIRNKVVVTHINNLLTDSDIWLGSYEGNINATAFLVNGYYDILTDSKLRSYVGAGIVLGVNSLQVSLKSFLTYWRQDKGFKF